MNRCVTLVGLALMVCLVSACDQPDNLPPMPEWQTDARHCQWDWHEGGAIGLWAETCQLPSGLWQIYWDSARSAFVQSVDGKDLGIVIQPWQFDLRTGIASLSEALVEHSALKPDAPCTWETMALHSAPDTMVFYTLSPVSHLALGMTDQAQVPDPVCGAYGRSTHGVRYFITDLRWPGWAIFVDEGQERPLFEPRSITVIQ